VLRLTSSVDPVAACAVTLLAVLRQYGVPAGKSSVRGRLGCVSSSTRRPFCLGAARQVFQNGALASGGCPLDEQQRALPIYKGDARRLPDPSLGPLHPEEPTRRESTER
jgi:hypothetical protein